MVHNALFSLTAIFFSHAHPTSSYMSSCVCLSSVSMCVSGPLCLCVCAFPHCPQHFLQFPGSPRKAVFPTHSRGMHQHALEQLQRHTHTHTHTRARAHNVLLLFFCFCFFGVHSTALQIHWLSIMNAAVLVVLLVGFVSVILVRQRSPVLPLPPRSLGPCIPHTHTHTHTHTRTHTCFAHGRLCLLAPQTKALNRDFARYSRDEEDLDQPGEAVFARVEITC